MLFCSWLCGPLCYFTSLSSGVILGEKSKLLTKTLLLNHILGGVSGIRVRVGVNSICSSYSCPALEIWVLYGRAGWGSSLWFPLVVLTEKGILVVFIARCCEPLSFFFFIVESVHCLANPSLKQRTCRHYQTPSQTVMRGHVFCAGGALSQERFKKSCLGTDWSPGGYRALWCWLLYKRDGEEQRIYVNTFKSNFYVLEGN